MGTPAELNRFLAEVEKRAYAMAMVTVRNRDDALDIVQDVMMTLARRYPDKAASEWRPLFFRMLRNRVTDFHRSKSVRARLIGWLSGDDDTGPQDPLEQAVGAEALEPERAGSGSQTARAINDALARLPARQREAFMLRAWEGMDVRETAAAMSCSSGSVKTHYSRAVTSLRALLEGSEDG